MKVSIPYLKMRNGRPRWEPGPALRRAGYKGTDLKTDDGHWMNLGDAMLAAQDLNAGVENWRVSGQKKRAATAPLRHAQSCDALFERWYASTDFCSNAPRTQYDYRRKARHFLAVFGEHHVRAVTKPQLVAFWELCYRERGHHMANGIKAVFSAAFSYAEIIGWRDPETNPALRLKRAKSPARVVLWLPAELTAFVAAADHIGIPSAADGLIIGLHSGQRLADVLAMPPRIFDEDRIRLTQFKRGALVDAPMTPLCLQRIKQIQTRRRHDTIPTIGGTMIVDGSDRAYTPRSFNSAFRAVRAAAAATQPTILEKRFQDLRDTAVTRLALAGSTMPEIASITGHSLPSITQIMKHYLALQPEMADEAIRKLNAWMLTNHIAI